MTSAPTPIHRPRLPHRRPAAWAAVVGLAVLVVVAAALLARSDVFGGSTHTTVLRGSGTPATETRPVGRFASIELAGANDVTVTVGAPRERVVVSADSNLLGRVTTEVWQGRLLIGTVGSFTTRAAMHVDVAVPELDALALSGSGALTARRVDAQTLTLSLDGSGILRVAGSADRLDVSLNGSGDAVLDRLAARDVRARLAGSGRIVVRASRSLDASVPGAGTIVYLGNPARVTSSVTGSGAVARG